MKNCFKDWSQSNVFVLQDKMALNGCNGCFLSADEDDDIVCQSKTAGSAEMIKVWHFWSIAGINCCLNPFMLNIYRLLYGRVVPLGHIGTRVAISAQGF